MCSGELRRSALHPFLWICVIEVVGLHFVTHTCFGGEEESYVEARSIHFHQFLTLPRYYYSPLNPAVPCIGYAGVLLFLFALVQLCCDVFCRVVLLFSVVLGASAVFLMTCCLVVPCCSYNI